MALFTTLAVRGDVYPKELEQMAMENLQRVVGLFLALINLLFSIIILVYLVLFRIFPHKSLAGKRIFPIFAVELGYSEGFNSRQPPFCVRLFIDYECKIRK